MSAALSAARRKRAAFPERLHIISTRVWGWAVSDHIFQILGDLQVHLVADAFHDVAEARVGAAPRLKNAKSGRRFARDDADPVGPGRLPMSMLIAGLKVATTPSATL